MCPTISAPAYRMDNLYPVVTLKPVCIVSISRYNFLIDLNCESLCAILQRSYQTRDCYLIGNGMRLSVKCNFH